MVGSNIPQAVRPDGRRGIGGWLILPMIGLFITPLQTVNLISVYKDGLIDFAYLSVAQQIFVVVELIGNLALVLVAPIFLLILLFRHSASFVRCYIAGAFASLAFIALDLVAAKLIFPEIFQKGEQLLDKDTWRAIRRTLLLVVIWVPYMLRSKRVRNTFGSASQEQLAKDFS